jgi:O-antigen/teichoic acid export membrane protein
MLHLGQRKSKAVKILLRQWIKNNSVMLVNAGSLVGATIVTSGLGFVYWWLAARRFPLEAVGIASASISTMTLLGTLCMLGLGTLLITELPRQPGREGSLISTALVVVGGTGGCIGILFAILAPYVSAEFQPLRANIGDILIFAIGIALTAITLVLDQALVGLLSGGLQLYRNTLFAIAKLVALFLASFWLSYAAGITIYATWTLANAFSLAALAGVALWKGKWSGRVHLPQWGLLRKLGGAALQHHWLNLTLQAPSLLIPVLVTVMLSAKMNAWFYVSSMLASFVTMIPVALTIVLHAMNSAQQSTLGHKSRVTIGLALVTCVLANCVLQFDTKQVLGLFGSTYAEQATWSLRILGLGAFPLIIKTHYISICRIHDRIARAMLGMLPGGLLELALAALGAHFGGLTGLCLGQTVAIYIESMFMFRTVFKTIRFVNTSPSTSIGQENREVNPIWLMDTSQLMSISQRFKTKPIWLMDTSQLMSISQRFKTKPIWLMDTSQQMSISQGYKIKAIKSIHTFLQTPKTESSLETEVEISKKCNQQNGVSKHNSIDRHRLRPIRLQQHVPDHESKPILDAYTNESDFKQ